MCDADPARAVRRRLVLAAEAGLAAACDPPDDDLSAEADDHRVAQITRAILDALPVAGQPLADLPLAQALTQELATGAGAEAHRLAAEAGASITQSLRDLTGARQALDELHLLADAEKAAAVAARDPARLDHDPQGTVHHTVEGLLRPTARALLDAMEAERAMRVATRLAGLRAGLGALPGPARDAGLALLSRHALGSPRQLALAAVARAADLLGAGPVPAVPRSQVIRLVDGHAACAQVASTLGPSAPPTLAATARRLQQEFLATACIVLTCAILRSAAAEFDWPRPPGMTDHPDPGPLAPADQLTFSEAFLIFLSLQSSEFGTILPAADAGHTAPGPGLLPLRAMVAPLAAQFTGHFRPAAADARLALLSKPDWACAYILSLYQRHSARVADMCQVLVDAFLRVQAQERAARQASVAAPSGPASLDVLDEMLSLLEGVLAEHWRWSFITQRSDASDTYLGRTIKETLNFDRALRLVHEFAPGARLSLQALLDDAACRSHWLESELTVALGKVTQLLEDDPQAWASAAPEGPFHKPAAGDLATVENLALAGHPSSLAGRAGGPPIVRAAERFLLLLDVLRSRYEEVPQEHVRRDYFHRVQLQACVRFIEALDAEQTRLAGRLFGQLPRGAVERPPPVDLLAGLVLLANTAGHLAAMLSQLRLDNFYRRLLVADPGGTAPPCGLLLSSLQDRLQHIHLGTLATLAGAVATLLVASLSEYTQAASADTLPMDLDEVRPAPQLGPVQRMCAALGAAPLFLILSPADREAIFRALCEALDLHLLVRLLFVGMVARAAGDFTSPDRVARFCQRAVDMSFLFRALAHLAGFPATGAPAELLPLFPRSIFAARLLVFAARALDAADPAGGASVALAGLAPALQPVALLGSPTALFTLMTESLLPGATLAERPAPRLLLPRGAISPLTGQDFLQYDELDLLSVDFAEYFVACLRRGAPEDPADEVDDDPVAVGLRLEGSLPAGLSLPASGGLHAAFTNAHDRLLEVAASPGLPALPTDGPAAEDLIDEPAPGSGDLAAASALVVTLIGGLVAGAGAGPESRSSPEHAHFPLVCLARAVLHSWVYVSVSG